MCIFLSVEARFNLIVGKNTMMESSSIHIFIHLFVCPVGWGCRIHRLLLYRGVRPPPNEYPSYDTKQSDGEFPIMP